MDFKKIIKEIILEDVAQTAKIKGSDADTALARGKYLRDKAMQNLSDLNVYDAKGHMAELGIFDSDYLSKSGSFGFSFNTKDGTKASGIAKYDKDLSEKEDAIVLDFKSNEEICFDTNKCYQLFKIKFSPKSTHRAYVQKFKVKFGVGSLKYGREESKGLRGLQEDYIFDVIILPFKGPLNQETGNQEAQGQEGGQEQKGRGQENQGGGSGKDGLYNDLTKFFQFIVNNKKQLNTKGKDVKVKNQPKETMGTVENIVKTITNNLLSEEDDKGGDIEPIKTQIKINKIGIKKPKGEYDNDNDSGKLTEENFTKVEGTINLPKEAKSLFDVTTLAKIINYLQKGIFYAKISQKTKNAIILSDSPNYNNKSQYVLLQSKKDIDVTNPQSWSNQKVKVGKNAMGNDELPSDIEGTIGQLKIVE